MDITHNAASKNPPRSYEVGCSFLLCSHSGSFLRKASNFRISVRPVFIDTAFSAVSEPYKFNKAYNWNCVNIKRLQCQYLKF